MPDDASGTHLFERKGDANADMRLVARAVKKRWTTDPKLAELVVKKLSHKALGLPWKNHDGTVEQPEPYNPHQLGMAATVLLNVERMNQAEEHHHDRLEFAREFKGQYNPAVRAAAKIDIGKDGEGKLEMGIAVYLPDNGRDPVRELMADPALPGVQ